MVCFRADDGEVDRLGELLEVVKRRNPLIDLTSMLRDLVGLTEHGFVLPAEREMLRLPASQPRLIPEPGESPPEKARRPGRSRGRRSGGNRAPVTLVAGIALGAKLAVVTATAVATLTA